MPHRYFFIFLLLPLQLLWAQVEVEANAVTALSLTTASSTVERPVQQRDTLTVKKDSLSPKKGLIVKEQKVAVIDTATIEMYEIFQQGKRTVHVDTTLTIQKEYKANFLREDYFELLPFVNVGSAFNRLGHDFTQTSLQPQMGARSKHYGYFEVEDVKYYRVPTPLTELFLERL